MNVYHDDTYLKALEQIYTKGTVKTDRTGTGTKSLFGLQMRFDLTRAFPLLTTKRLYVRGIFHELLWFLNGDTNIKYLTDNGVHIWDEWADANGDLGPVYGKQWRDWNGIDQLADIMAELKAKPDSRRLVVSAWNVADLPQMKLQPCHCLFQLYVADGRLSCQLYQRSADFFLGVPFNIASYAALTHMIAQQADLDVHEFIWTGGDCHIYSNHYKQVEEQLKREPFASPTFRLGHKPHNLFSYRYTDFIIEGYQAHEPIKAPVAV